MKKKKFKEFLEWLITPKEPSSKEYLIDNCMSIKNRLNDMTKEELIEEINMRISHLGLEVNVDGEIKNKERKK